MLKLVRQEPEWKDVLPGVRILFAPVTTAALRAAQRAAAVVFRAAADLGAENVEEATLDAGDGISRELLARAILQWEGVGDADGNPVDPTPEWIGVFLDDPTCFQAADAVYVHPWLDREREKNGSSPSPSGISAGETPGTDTANSAAQQTAAGDATNAPTSSRSRGRKKARSSGK